MSAKHNNLKEYEVEKVVDHRYRKTAFPDGSHDEYLIKWKHYPSSQNTWEPESHLNPLALAEARRLKSSAPPPRKKRNLTKRIDDIAAELSADEVAIIFSFLPPKAIMRARVCKTWRDAAQKIIVPPTDFAVRDATSYNAMRAISTALPNLQQLTLFGLRNEKYTNGDDPDRAIAQYTAYERTHDINVISNFSKLRILKLQNAPLNGRYPALFNFPLLEELTIVYCHTLKWDLEMLSGCPLLKELYSTSDYPTGNISSLRVLKNTLEKVMIACSTILRGNLMDLADFPHLKELNLQGTDVTGDIRAIRADDFPAIKKLVLPQSVVGGNGYEFERISDVPVFVQAILPLVRRSPSLVKDWNGHGDWYWTLSQDSPDWYEEDEEYRDEGGDPPPPFYVEFVQAGTRLGWTWYTSTIIGENIYCAVNWLDPEPSSDSDDYETYIRELQEVNRRIGWLYENYHEPPNEEQYRRICVEFREYEGRA